MTNPETNHSAYADTEAESRLQDYFRIDGPGLAGKSGTMMVSASSTSSIYGPGSGAPGYGLAKVNGVQLPLDGSAVEVAIRFGFFNSVELLSVTGRVGHPVGAGNSGEFIDNSWGAWNTIGWGGIETVELDEALPRSSTALTASSGFDYREAAGEAEVLIVPEPSAAGMLVFAAWLLGCRRRA